MTNIILNIFKAKKKSFASLKKAKLKSVFTFASIFLFLFVVFILLQKPKFNEPYSTLLEDRNGKLLGAVIAADGQWRFPESGKINPKFEKALLMYEDRYFYSHPGLNPVSILRALTENIKKGSVVQGGSTITMQVIRLSRKNPGRTVTEKIWEMLLAVSAEVHLPKDRILSLYAAHAPFGGNVVGIEAASWRYFGRKPDALSWGEAALLAVLPNSPSLIYPGKNQQILLKKRNRLIRKLLAAGIIDKITCSLAEVEPLPQAPQPLPRLAPHAIFYFKKRGLSGKRIRSSIKADKQYDIAARLNFFSQKLKTNSIHNGAVLVLEVQTGKVVAYVGNTVGSDLHNGHDVDIIGSRRSYGSLFKPMLYAALLEEGLLLPRQLVPDIPLNIAGYKPENFFKDYDGAVAANEVLSRSLNVPSVRLLHEMGVARFQDILSQSGISTLGKPASHYGLSMILGGGEATLWEITALYASLARTALWRRPSFAPPVFFNDSTLVPFKKQPDLNPASVWFTLQAISESKRPGNEGEWLIFPQVQQIAWKTGTSFGSRDAWAVGVSSKYAVGVWLGNASGEGRAGLTGVGTAAPLMFDVFEMLDNAQAFPEPFAGIKTASVCKQSGYIASRFCPDVREETIPAAGTRSKPCPYHYLLHLNMKGKRVNSRCSAISEMKHESWFILPAIQEWYYKPKHPDYKPLPEWDKRCQENEEVKNLDVIYPKKGTRIYIPTELTGRMGMTVFEAAHRKREAIVYWHIDNEYVTETKGFHQVSFELREGWHTLNLTDNNGENVEVRFEVMSKKKN